MTLTDFLLARIAEDEAVAQGVVNRPDRHLPCDPSRLHDTGTTDLIAHGSNVAMGTFRALAECQAKRQVIDWLRVTEDSQLDSMPWQVMKKVIACLALPYADHPDYQQDWAV